MGVSEDKNRLNKFIKDIYDWLDTCYLDQQKKEHLWPVIRPYVTLRAYGQDAWQELKIHQPMAKFLELIKSVDERKLLAHGLSGAQLTYKLAVLEDLISRMKKAVSPARFRHKLIDAIDTILDSLISAVGAGTALKEIKDMLRAQI